MSTAFPRTFLGQRSCWTPQISSLISLSCDFRYQTNFLEHRLALSSSHNENTWRASGSILAPSAEIYIIMGIHFSLPAMVGGLLRTVFVCALLAADMIICYLILLHVALSGFVARENPNCDQAIIIYIKQVTTNLNTAWDSLRVNLLGQVLPTLATLIIGASVCLHVLWILKKLLWTLRRQPTLRFARNCFSWAFDYIAGRQALKEVPDRDPETVGFWMGTVARLQARLLEKDDEIKRLKMARSVPAKFATETHKRRAFRLDHIESGTTTLTWGDAHKDKPVSVADIDDQGCSVCWENFELSDILAALPCGHCFHEDCLQTWHKQSFTCPRCTRSLMWVMALEN